MSRLSYGKPWHSLCLFLQNGICLTISLDKNEAYYDIPSHVNIVNSTDELKEGLLNVVIKT